MVILPNSEAAEAAGPPSYDNLNYEDRGTVEFATDYTQVSYENK